MCNCGSEVKMQEYQNQVTVPIPPHMESYRTAREKAGLTPLISIDRCILPEIQALWDLGIHTHGSCCGHNAQCSMVNVRKEDDSRMVDLGYIRWPHSPDGCCRETFFLKSVPMEKGAPMLLVLASESPQGSRSEAEGPSPSSPPAPPSQGAEAGINVEGVLEYINGLRAKVEILEVALRDKTLEAEAVHANNEILHGQLAALRAPSERAPEAPALDPEAIRKDLEGHLDPDFVRTYIMPHLESPRELDPSPSGRDAKRVEEPDAVFSHPCATIKLFGLHGGTEHVPTILAEASQQVRALLDNGMIRFSLNAPPAESSPPLPNGEGSVIAVQMRTPDSGMIVPMSPDRVEAALSWGYTHVTPELHTPAGEGSSPETSEEKKSMKAHKVTLVFVDHDEVGAEEAKLILENTRYPNRCIAPEVMEIQTVDIGEWTDDHPLNLIDPEYKEWRKLFAPEAPPAPPAAPRPHLDIEHTNGSKQRVEVARIQPAAPPAGVGALLADAAESFLAAYGSSDSHPNTVDAAADRLGDALRAYRATPTPKEGAPDLEAQATRNVLETYCEPLGLRKGMALWDLAYIVTDRLSHPPAGPAVDLVENLPWLQQDFKDLHRLHPYPDPMYDALVRIFMLLKGVNRAGRSPGGSAHG